MHLSPSAHVDTFCRDNLPPPGQWPELLFDLPGLTYPERLNCGTALLDETSERLGADRPCLVTATRTWTYGELRRRTDQIARVLTEDFGLVPGNRVLLRGPNNPGLVAAWFGVIKAGGVVVTTVPLLRPAEISTLIDLTEPVLAITDHRFAEDLESAAGTTLPILYYGGDTEDDLDARADSKEARFTAVETAADDVALLAPTSGTTGKPKITMHFHRDVLAIADTFARHVLDARSDDLFTGTPPLGFTFGLGSLVVFPLRVGAASLLLERTNPRLLAEAIQHHRVSVLFTAPTAYKALLASGDSAALLGLRRCVSAGEHLPESTWQAFHRQTGIRIIDGIGATELLHIFISAAGEEIRPGSTGKVVPGYQAAIVDDDCRPVPDGTPGRLAVKGPIGCRYLRGDRQEAYVRNGWNLTGDTYIRDSDGYFWYQARSDDMIVSSGYNIGGPEVENALLSHPDVAEAAVVGVPDPDRGAIVKAFVVLKEGADGSTDKGAELQAFVKSTIAPYKYPRAIDFVSALPRTATGKIQRYRLRADG